MTEWSKRGHLQGFPFANTNHYYSYHYEIFLGRTVNARSFTGSRHLELLIMLKWKIHIFIRLIKKGVVYSSIGLCWIYLLLKSTFVTKHPRCPPVLIYFKRLKLSISTNARSITSVFCYIKPALCTKKNNKKGDGKGTGIVWKS